MTQTMCLNFWNVLSPPENLYFRTYEIFIPSRRFIFSRWAVLTRDLRKFRVVLEQEFEWTECMGVCLKFYFIRFTVIGRQGHLAQAIFNLNKWKNCLKIKKGIIAKIKRLITLNCFIFSESFSIFVTTR